MSPANAAKSTLGDAETIVLTAAVMALGALSIDIMLPALGEIGRELGAASANDAQSVVYAFTIGYGVSQLIFGPLTDRFGRRRILVIALACYAGAAAISAFSSSFALLLAARALQGALTAATRVAIMASVRDRFEGARMAEVASAATTVFMAAPILAPAIGQAILLAGEWRSIFIFLSIYGAALCAWIYFRMGETLKREARRSLSFRSAFSAYAAFSRNRQSAGYTLAVMVLWGAFFAYLGAAQQIYVGEFGIGALFPLAFAAGAAPYGAAALLNAFIVRRTGIRRLLHGGVCAIIAFNALHLLIATQTGQSLSLFIMTLCATLFALGFVGANATALALEPMGALAGAASAANGFAATTGAALIGMAIGRMFNGATTLISEAFLAMGAASLAVIFWTERGKLFLAEPAVATEVK